MAIHKNAMFFAVFAVVLGALESSALSCEETELGSRCKYHKREGYWFGELIHIDKFTNKLSNEEDFINLPIWAKASRDAVILLSSVEKPNFVQGSAPVYEIVIGGRYNQDCFLKSGFVNPTEQTTNTPAILSPLQYRPFTMRLMRNGTLSVYATQVPLPIISHTFSSPLNIQWIGFSSWNGSVSQFYYDCSPSARDRLWRDVFEGKNLTALVRLPINVDEKTIDSSVRIVATWRYDNITWNPQDYDNITAYNLDWAPKQTWSITVTSTGYELVLPLRTVSNEGNAYAESKKPSYTPLTAQRPKQSYTVKHN